MEEVQVLAKGMVFSSNVGGPKQAKAVTDNSRRLPDKKKSKKKK